MIGGVNVNEVLDRDILNFALQNGIIDINTIQKQIEMNERRKYLDMHQIKCWKSTDGKWYTYLPDESFKNGRRLIKRSTQKALEDEIVAFYKAIHVDPTIESVFEEWITKKLNYKQISKQTGDRYRVDFNRFFNDEIRQRKIKYVDEEFLESFVLDSINNNNLKSKAWGNLRIIIRGMFLYAKKKGYTNFSIVTFLNEIELSKNMFSHDRKPESNTVFTQKEINEIVKYIGCSKNITDMVILFAIYTGMRVGEIVALKWEDIGDKFINVNRTQIRFKVDGKVVHEIRDFPKTESGIRNVVIVPELREVIRRARIKNAFTEYVFERKDACVPKHSVCTRLYYICDALNIERKGMHAIRKYYATKLINAGIEEIIITSQMGHSDFSTTKNFYYKNNNEKSYICDRVSYALSE